MCKLTPFLILIAFTAFSQKELEIKEEQFYHFFDEGLIDSAYHVATEMKNVALSDYGDTSEWYGFALAFMSDCEFEFQLFDKGIKHKKEALNVFRNYQPDYYIYITLLDDLAYYYEDHEDYPNALIYYQESKEVTFDLLGGEDYDYLIALRNLARIHYLNKEYNEALAINKDLLLRPDLWEESMSHAFTLDNIASCYYALEKTDSAIIYWEQALEAKEKEKEAVADDFLISHSVLADVYSELLDYEKSIMHYEKLMRIEKKEFGKHSSNYINSMNSLGLVYWDKGDYHKAEDCMLSVLKLSDNADVSESDRSMYRNNLGLIYTDLGEFENAEEIFQKDSQVIQKIFGKESEEFAMNRNNLGLLYMETGEFERSEKYFNEAVNIRKKAGIEKTYEIANLLENLAILYMSRGNYEKAEEYLLEVMAIKKNYYGENSFEFAGVLSNLAVFYDRMGNYDHSEELALEGIHIQREMDKDNDLSFAEQLSNLGSFYLDLGELNKAEVYLLEAYELFNQLSSKKDLSTGALLINLGLLKDEQGDDRSAIRYFNEALIIYSDVLGAKNTESALCLNNIANVYWDNEEYDKAEEFFIKSLEVYEEIFPEQNELTTMLRGNLSLFYWDIGNYEKASVYFKEAFNDTKQEVISGFAWLSQNEKRLFWESKKDYFSDADTYVSQNAEDSLSASLAYDGCIFKKSLLLESSSAMKRAIFNSGDSSLIEDYHKLNRMKNKYATLSARGASQEKIQIVLQLIDSLDKQLVNSTVAYSQFKARYLTNWKDVRAKLKPEEAAIEFVRYQREEDSAFNYMALVVRENFSFPKVVILGAEEEINKYNPMIDQKPLYDLIWRPLDTLLSDVNKIYYSPDGALNNVSFSTLCTGQEEFVDTIESSVKNQRGTLLEYAKNISYCKKYLMDRYELVQLTTTRYLVDQTISSTSISNYSIALFGGVDYNTMPDMTDISAGHEKNEWNENIAFQSRSSSNLGRMKYLKGSEVEVKFIDSLLQANAWETSLWMSSVASENRMKELQGEKAPEVLHISSHGFAFPELDSTLKSQKGLKRQKMYQTAEDPMVRSGLLFAGANYSWLGNTGKMYNATGEDGVLTAAEVAAMDLHDTKLVILSACETGVGKIEDGEGVFGLNRGFKLAGVDQLIISLWSVPDKETMEMMRLFYQYLTTGKDPKSAFDLAQLNMREIYPTRPELWGGFIFVR